jgi:hypothetical protein
VWLGSSLSDIERCPVGFYLAAGLTVLIVLLLIVVPSVDKLLWTASSSP